MRIFLLMQRFFQFTTSQGGRHKDCRHVISCLNTFNSRPHKEVDSDQRDGCCPIFLLSIHDLTRRSTSSGRTVILPESLSIHDLTRRSTLPVLKFSLAEAFQFTTSQGGRPSYQDRLSHSQSFNSRPHKEVDVCAGTPPAEGYLSIHDLTRRSTVIPQDKMKFRNTFQFTTSQGGRQGAKSIQL